VQTSPLFWLLRLPKHLLSNVARHKNHLLSVRYTILTTLLYKVFNKFMEVLPAVEQLVTGWRSGFWILKGEHFYLLQNVQTGSRAHRVSYSMVSGVPFRWQSGRGFKSTTHLHLVLKVRMRGAIPLLHLYAFMAWKGTTSPFYLLSTEVRHISSSMYNSLSSVSSEGLHARVSHMWLWSWTPLSTTGKEIWGSNGSEYADPSGRMLNFLMKSY
jgi:hypothetical protein